MISEQPTQEQPLSPPVVSFKNRQPNPALVSTVGPILATFIENYHQAGPIYRSYDGYTGKDAVTLSGVDANLFVTNHGRSHFGARDFRRTQLDELGSDKYLVGMDGEAHHCHRKRQARGYSRAILDQRYPELQAIVQRHATTWQPGQSLMMYRVLQEIVTEQLGATLLNYAMPDKWKTLCSYVSALLMVSFPRGPVDQQRWNVYQQIKREVMGLMDEVIAAHRAQPSGEHRPDLIDDLLRAAEEEGAALTEQDLRIGALSVYIAGIEPVVHSCTFMLYALLRHPHILEQVVAEVDRVVGDGPLTPAALRELKCLHGATLETLRMYPFAPVLQMSALQDFEFEGYHIAAGTPVTISQAVTHFLPEFYPDPYVFDIERYGPERGEHRRSGAFAPYGVGHHTCLGAGFADVQIMLTMATLLHTVEFTLDPDAEPPIPSIAPGRLKLRVARQRQPGALAEALPAMVPAQGYA